LSEGLSPAVLAFIFEAFGIPNVDLSTSDTWHVAPVFVILCYMPECLAMYLLSHDWEELVPTRSLAWVFLPVRAILEAIQHLKEPKSKQS
jgi:hypothetical protein